MELEIYCTNKKNVLMGLMLMLVGLALPLSLTVDSFHVMEDTLASIRQEDPLLMLSAGMNLVSLNILRSLPNYLGLFVLAENLRLMYRGRERKLAKYLLMFLLMAAVYLVLDDLLHVRYDFGLPAVVLILLVILFNHADFDLVSLLKKQVMIAMFIVAVQFTDIMPFLSGLPIGHGAASTEVKLAAAFLGREKELQIEATMFCVLFLLIGLIVLQMVRDENHLRRMDKLVQQNQEITLRAQVQELENRTHHEIQHLVHDLKSPLTSAQGLVSLCQYACDQKGEEQLAGYLTRAEASIDTMNSMISDILSEDHRTELTTEELLNATLAQLSVASYAGLIHTENRAPDSVVSVNKIRFIRALINLSDNASRAVDGTTGQIWLRVRREEAGDGPWVLFQVEDNGTGIEPDALEHLWDRGFSTKGSHGLGLSFVQKVVQDLGGTAQVLSKAGQGTCFTVRIPEEGVSEDAE